MTIKRAFCLKALAVIAVATLLASVPAGVQAAPAQGDPGCDTEFLDAVDAKGWLEGQRDLTQSENLLSKSDSVLEYTCFQQMLETLAVKAGPQFSESVLWSQVPGLTWLSLDISLEQIVGQELIAYLQANFAHTYRGGRDIPGASQAITRNPGAYVCGAMKYVWEKSKCAQFMEKEPKSATNANFDIDGFYEFSRYATTDPRRLPIQVASCAAPTENYALAGNAAYNIPAGGTAGVFPNTYYVMPTENPNDAAHYHDDPLTSRLQFILPSESCGTDFTPAGAPIPTGITIHQSGTVLNAAVDNDYEEHICGNPGCSYEPASQKCTR
jgi:hypothetical protein